MNDAFENFVGGILHRIVDKTPHLRLIVDEPEMQTAWKEKMGKTPSVCDWMLFGQGHCAVIDATNHAVKAEAAQGLATWDDGADIEKIFTEGKFRAAALDHRLRKEARRLGRRKGRHRHNVRSSRRRARCRVSHRLLAQFDIVVRSYKAFAHLQPQVYARDVVPITDIQLLEGMADLAPKIPQFPGKDPDMMELISGWRWAATEPGEASLQMFLLRRGLPVPLSDHILKNSSKQIELLSKN